MKNQGVISLLVILIAILSGIAATTGIFSSGGPGSYQIESVRGEMVTLYGEGIYKHMSEDVAPQGIAQDYITLFVAIPILILSLIWAKNSSLRGRILLAGTLGYFLVTYLFYLVMGMYNILFLIYVALLGCSFFAFTLTMLSFELDKLSEYFDASTPRKFAGGFLIFNSVAIGFMWLGVVVPPLLDSTIIPKQVEHYTTLIVQGLDLGLLLPLAFLAGLLLIKRNPFGYLLTPVYLVFLSIMMTALTAKLIAMGLLGQNIMPAIIIIPLFALVAISCVIQLFKSIREEHYEKAEA